MNALLLIEALAPLLPHLIAIAEKTFPGKKRGKTKKAAVLRAVEHIAGEVPNYVRVAREVSKQIDAAVAASKDSPA